MRYILIPDISVTIGTVNQPDLKAPEITQMLRECSDGNKAAWNDLLPLVYDELHRQAARYLRKERPGHTLQTTALIHEAYLKLIDQRCVNWESRTHFFAIAAQAMRRILVDYARATHRKKRGGDDIKVSLNEGVLAAAEDRSVDLIALDEALNKLAERDEQQARIVELRYFSGMTLEETAEALHIARATVASDWSMAKVWLFRELSG
ncbi:MAG TPA: sigma-70 family RNA polymerase sigma factor [Pyrinomonadaceae bacterium]|nr:sigma-70 family RNA polymerase sigma factor [Pyrinomonadaceae bacterium]